MRKYKQLTISILSLTLCVLVTFAWINELQNPEGRVMTLRFNEAAVAGNELEVRLSVNVQDDIFEDITGFREDVSGESRDLESFDNFAPGSVKKFKVDITNLGTTSVNLRVILSDIICENQELRESVVIGTNGFLGFNTDYPAPIVQNQRLAEGIDKSGNFTLVNNVEIPPDNADTPVSIYFYIIFSASGSENLEDMSFSIGAINFLTL